MTHSKNEILIKKQIKFENRIEEINSEIEKLQNEREVLSRLIVDTCQHLAHERFGSL